MDLNAPTLRNAITLWLNHQNLSQDLRCIDVRVKRDGGAFIRFEPKKVEPKQIVMVEEKDVSEKPQVQGVARS